MNTRSFSPGHLVRICSCNSQKLEEARGVDEAELAVEDGSADRQRGERRQGKRSVYSAPPFENSLTSRPFFTTWKR